MCAAFVGLLCCSCGPAVQGEAPAPAERETTAASELVPPTTGEPVDVSRNYLSVADFQEAMREANPGYTRRGVFVTDAAKRVVEADLSRCGLTRLEPFAQIALKVLDLSGNAVDDLSSLSGMPLRVLQLDDTAVSDLSPLLGVPLDRLSLVKSKVVDLAPLREAQLTHLDLRQTKVSDLSALAKVRLVELRLDGTKVSDLSPLAKCPLNRLTLSHTLVSDLSPLRGRPLRVVDVSGTRVSDLTPLLDSKLRRLAFTPGRIQVGMSGLRRMRSLRELGESLSRCRAAPEYWKEIDAK